MLELHLGCNGSFVQVTVAFRPLQGTYNRTYTRDIVEAIVWQIPDTVLSEKWFCGGQRDVWTFIWTVWGPIEFFFIWICFQYQAPVVVNLVCTYLQPLNSCLHWVDNHQLQWFVFWCTVQFQLILFNNIWMQWFCRILFLHRRLEILNAVGRQYLYDSQISGFLQTQWLQLFWLGLGQA
jgi:hypothetical protein